MIGVTEAAELLRRAVAERGEDYVYPQELKVDTPYGPSCMYVQDSGEPVCIVGLAFSYVFPPEQMKTIAQTERAADFSLGASAILSEIDRDKFSPEAKQLLDDAQHWQDGGLKWGVSVDRALSRLC